MNTTTESAVTRLRAHHGGWAGLEAAPGIQARTWNRWAAGTRPRGLNIRIASRPLREAQSPNPWLVPAMARLVEAPDGLL
jgi:hypothetical protein